MIIGEYVAKGSANTAGSPTFPRGGLGAVLTVTVLQLVGTPSIVIEVEHKNSEDTSFSNLGNFASINATGTYSVDLTGIKEEVRFFYNVTAPCMWEKLLLLMTAPAWRPYA